METKVDKEKREANCCHRDSLLPPTSVSVGSGVYTSGGVGQGLQAFGERKDVLRVTLDPLLVIPGSQLQG